jgi:hypothetical protein
LLEKEVTGVSLSLKIDHPGGTGPFQGCANGTHTRVTHTPDDVLYLTKEAIKKDREVQDRIAKLPASECKNGEYNTYLCGCDLSSHHLGLCKRFISIFVLL